MVIHHGSHSKGKDMKTLFVVADVHGFFKEMCHALAAVGFDIHNDNHIFVSCGDLLDRGKEPIACLHFVNMLPEHRKILIMGNHEELMVKAIRTGYFNFADKHNGTDDTVYRVTGIRPGDTINPAAAERTALMSMMANEDWDKYIHSCINYYETDKYIFVHGYVPIQNDGDKILVDPDWQDDFANWEQARWLNGMSMWKMGARIPGKTIVCGHWHSSYGHARFHDICREFDKDENGVLKSVHTPFYEDGLIAMDACTVYSGFVNCIKIEVEDE